MSVALPVCVIGAGPHFLSGISYYTHHLVTALSERHSVAVILMRRLIPERLYPGRDRVGAITPDIDYAADRARVFDGVDWFWAPSIIHATALLIHHRPRVVIFEWWTGSVLHTYLLQAFVARLLRAKIVVEFHEVVDTGEAGRRFWMRYVDKVAPLLFRQADAFVVHSESDRAEIERRHRPGDRPVEVILHGPYDHMVGTARPERVVPRTACNLLFFGTIRPYKGLEDLVIAFDRLPDDVAGDFWLTVVGETWEGWELPTELIASSRRRDRITFVNRYVTDTEAAGFFAGADVVVLPYLRSSASGPLHIAMSHGLPVVVTDVGGLPEAVAGYEGARLVQPGDPDVLCDAILACRDDVGRCFVDARSWNETALRFDSLFVQLGLGSEFVEADEYV